MIVTDGGYEEPWFWMNKKTLVYFQIVFVLFYDILQHNRILIKETLQTVIRIIVLLNNIYKCQALIRT